MFLLLSNIIFIAYVIFGNMDPGFVAVSYFMESIIISFFVYLNIRKNEKNNIKSTTLNGGSRFYAFTIIFLHFVISVFILSFTLSPELKEFGLSYSYGWSFIIMVLYFFINAFLDYILNKKSVSDINHLAMGSMIRPFVFNPVFIFGPLLALKFGGGQYILYVFLLSKLFFEYIIRLSRNKNN